MCEFFSYEDKHIYLSSCVGYQTCGGAICKVNGAGGGRSYSLGSLSDITYDPNTDALWVRYVEVID